MPQVEVVYARGKRVPDHVRYSLRANLPTIVSSALHVEKEGMRLMRQDIGVRFREAGSDDILTHDVEIKITGNYYPERFKGLQKVRAPKIADEIDAMIPSNLSCYVWVVLEKAAFVELSR
jgi:hypothetical protein